MPPDVAHWFAVVLDFIGSLFLAAFCVAALISAARTHIRSARLHIAEGAIWALSFKTAAALLKTLELRSWNSLLTFATILALRIILKHVFAWESRKLLTSHEP